MNPPTLTGGVSPSSRFARTFAIPPWPYNHSLLGGGMKAALILYVPVLHRGYLNLFSKYAKKVDVLFILDADLIKEFTALHGEIRMLPPALVRNIVSGLKLFKRVELLSRTKTKQLGKIKINLTISDEEITRKVLKKYLPAKKIIVDSAFLRWDEKNIASSAKPKYAAISKNPFDRKIIEIAKKEGRKSSDWWRQVGAVLARGKKILLQNHNQHVPSEHLQYTEGDPRDFIKAGIMNELTTALHAEQMVIAEAGRKGIKLQGTSLYTNVFPCPMCAKLIAYSGIKKCYFSSGVASLDGERILKSKGVRLILVK